MLRSVVASAQEIDFQSIKIQRVKPVNFDWSLDDDRLVKIFKPFIGTEEFRPAFSALFYNKLFLAATDTHIIAYLPVPSPFRKKIGEPGAYLLPALHTPKFFEKTLDRTKPENENPKDKRIDVQIPNHTAVFPKDDDVKERGSFSPYTLLTYLKAVEPYVAKGRAGAVITKVNGEEIAFDPKYLTTMLNFFLKLGFEKLHYFYVGQNNTFVIAPNSKLPGIRNSLEIEQGRPSPKAPKINKNLSFDKDTAIIIMPKMVGENVNIGRSNKILGYGVYNEGDDKFVKAYYDFSQDAIIEDGEEIKTYPFTKNNRASKAQISDRQAKFIKSVAKSKFFAELNLVMLKDGTLYASNLESQYILPDVSNKEDGLYQLNGKSLNLDNDLSVNNFPKVTNINDIGPATCEIEAAKLLSLLELSKGIEDVHKDGHVISVQPFSYANKDYTMVVASNGYILQMVNVETKTKDVTNKLLYKEAYKHLRGKGLKEEKLSFHSAKTETETPATALKLPDSSYLVIREPDKPSINPNDQNRVIELGTQYETGLLVNKSKLAQSLEEAFAWINDDWEISWDYNARGDQFLYKKEPNGLDELRTNSLGAVGEERIPNLKGAEILMTKAIEVSGNTVLPITKRNVPNLIKALKNAEGKSVYLQKSSRFFTFFIIPDKQPEKPKTNPNVKKAKAKAKAQKQRIRLLAMAS